MELDVAELPGSGHTRPRGSTPWRGRCAWGEQIFTREQLHLNGTDGLALVIYSPRASSVGTTAAMRQTGGAPSVSVRAVVRNP